MGGSGRCIGGVLLDGTSVRLLDLAGHHFDATAPFQVGEVWDIEFTCVTSIVPPHVEDVLVTNYKFVRTLPNPKGWLLKNINPWKGGIGATFEGKIGSTAKNNSYVCRGLGVPARSTWFWVPDEDLTLRQDGRHYDYYAVRAVSGGLAYVGETPAVESIPAGTLVRVSLARWWKPSDADESLDERCYLQLSGWF
jgi:hypothetical protein